MQIPVPEYIRTLVPYVPGKPIEETRREYKIKKIIKLASNENPLGPSPKGMRAAARSLKDIHRYPDASAFALKGALSRHLRVKPESISVGNGSNEIIDLLIRGFCRPGDAIATHGAAFVAYRLSAQAHGVETLTVPVDSDLRPDLGELLQKVRSDDRIKLVFLANPNNPTGVHLREKELSGFIEEASKVRGGTVLIILDSAYWEYVTARDLPDAMKYQRRHPQVVVLRTFSKVYGLAGLRVGYGVGDPSVMTILERIRTPFNVTSPALEAARAALEDHAFVARAVKLNTRGLKFWAQNLDAAGVKTRESQGNFILADVRSASGKSGPEIFELCLRKGVIFRPVANYGLPDHLRISIGTAEENETAFRVLKKALEGK